MSSSYIHTYIYIYCVYIPWTHRCLNKLTKVLQYLCVTCHCDIQINKEGGGTVRHGCTPPFITIFDDMFQSVCGLLSSLISL